MNDSGIKLYGRVICVKQAWLFDLGGLLMRMCTYMFSLGTITMLTLSGWSYFLAGTVAFVIAIAIFLIGPQVSRQVDKRGQSVVLPIAGFAVVLGLFIMTMTVQFNGPKALCYLGAIFMGFNPSPQALVRARWSYLLETGKLGENRPELKTVFAYEGILDDAGYMIGPCLSLALAALLFPTAGMLVGGIAFIIGMTMLLASKATEPEVGWHAVEREEELPASGKGRNMLFESSMVRVLFMFMLFQGMCYGVYNSALVAFGQEQNASHIISIIMALTGVGSIIAGFVFGAVKLKASMGKQLVVTSIAFGVLYALLFLVSDMSTLAIICVVASFSYAPLLITMNTACEKSVPGARLTESLTWIQAGATLGSTVSPTIGGIFVDLWGSLAGLNFSATCAVAMALSALACIPVIRKHLGW